VIHLKNELVESTVRDLNGLKTTLFMLRRQGVTIDFNSVVDSISARLNQLQDTDLFPSAEKARAEWSRLEGDRTLRYQYPDLTDQSNIWDIGGFQGEWAKKIWSFCYGNVRVYEPVSSYVDACRASLWFNPESRDKIKILPYGLSGVTGVQKVYLEGDASSTVRGSGAYQKIKFVGIVEELEKFFSREMSRRLTGDERPAPYVSLMKLNIEGGEFDLLETLVREPRLIRRVHNIQVQFHDFVTGAVERRARLQELLSETHERTYDFPFVWESWKVRPPKPH